MVEEVVGSIIQAEDRAEAIRKEGKEGAARLLGAAQVRSEECRALCAKECRALSDERKKIAAAEAQTAYDNVLREGRAQAEDLRAAWDKNVKRAADVIVSALLG